MANRVVGQLLDERIERASAQSLNQSSLITSVVTGIDYFSRQVEVNLRGASGARVEVGSLDLGTKSNPKVVVGATALLALVGGDFIVVNFTNTGLASNAVQPLAVPGNFAVKLTGTQIQATWDAVPGALFYEVYYNVTPKLNNSLRLPGMPVSTMSVILSNPSTGELLGNGGFESGDLTGWEEYHNPVYNGTPRVTEVTPAYKHNGAYAFHTLNATYSDTIIASNYFPVQPGTLLNASVWVKSNIFAGSLFKAYVSFFDGVEVSIDGSPPPGTLGPIPVDISPTIGVFDWTKYSDSSVVPTGKTLARFFISIYRGTGAGLYPDIYWDDCSVLGSNDNYFASYFYAVRAIGSTGQVSAFSSWIQPRYVKAALGNAGAPHIQLDPDTAAIQSSNYDVGGVGFTVDPTDGVSGQINAVEINTSEPAITYPGKIWLDTSGL